MKLLKMVRAAYHAMKTGCYVRALSHGKLQEKTVLLESKNAKDLAGNIFRLLGELTTDPYRDFKVYLSVCKESKASIKAMTERYGLTGFYWVNYDSNRYYKLLATAKYLVEDTSFPAKFIKREGQIYLNTWHGTPWKMMGRDDEAGAYAIGNVQKNFFYADYLLYPNHYMKDIMFSAYMLQDLYQGTVLYEGYPRNGIFFDEKRREQVRRELGMEDKQVIVYMPTWRNSTDRDTIRTEEAGACIFDVLDDLLTENQIFYVKFHVLASKTSQFEDYKRIRPAPKDYEAYDFLNAADVLVTDYSSVMFDFANTGRKIILFPYDLEEYIGARGLYTSLEDMPFPKVYSARELFEEINRPKQYNDQSFRERFCAYDSPEATKRLAKQVFLGENVCEMEKLRQLPGAPKKVLLYSAGMDQNGLTASLLNLFQFADCKNIKYYFTFFQGSFKTLPTKIRRIPEGINFFPINGTVTDHTLVERIAFKLFYGFNIDTPLVYKYVRRLYEREFRKHFAGIPFDGVIHFTGYSIELTTMFSTPNCRKAIFVHSDMLREIATRRNHHLPTLKHAYRAYDVVVAVSEGVKRSLAEICPEEKIQVIENAHDDAGVKRKALMELELSDETLLNVSEEHLRQVLADETLVRFINVGRFSPEKGQKKLLDAFDRFHAEHPETVLFIIGGNGTYYNEILQYAEERNCADSVILIRALANPFPVLNRCHLFLLSSDYEALGLVLLEAESLNVPAIATDIPGSGDFIRKHGGTTVENSVEGLYQGMCAFYEGKVHPLGISFDEYNNKSVDQFNKLFL